MIFAGLGLFVIAMLVYALDFLGVFPGAAGIANLLLVGAMILLAIGACLLPLYTRHHRQSRQH